MMKKKNNVINVHTYIPAHTQYKNPTTAIHSTNSRVGACIRHQQYTC